MAWGLLLVFRATLLPHLPCLRTKVRVAAPRGIPGSPWSDPGGEVLVLLELILRILNFPGRASGYVDLKRGLLNARSALMSGFGKSCVETTSGNLVKLSAFGVDKACDLICRFFSRPMQVAAASVLGLGLKRS